MASFVLVHGAWQGSWCWQDVVPLLAGRGHRVRAIDLPAHGRDQTRADAVTLDDYVDAIVGAVLACDQPALLVAHSMGGVAMQAGERIPDRLKAIVYVAATLPAHGTTMLETVAGFDPEYAAQIVWAEDRRSARITPEGACAFLYTSCPPDRINQVLPLLTPEPVAPFETPIQITRENLGRVPSSYVECLRDRAVPIALQRTMQNAARVVRVHTLDADHSPFFSAPRELAAALHVIASDT
jgi:pimeloyl-ACP methyl ester carboxylesterase